MLLDEEHVSWVQSTGIGGSMLLDEEHVSCVQSTGIGGSMLLDEEHVSCVQSTGIGGSMLPDEELGSDEEELESEKSCAANSFPMLLLPNCSLTRTIAVSNAPKISSATIAVCDPCRWNFWNGCTGFLSL